MSSCLKIFQISSESYFCLGLFGTIDEPLNFTVHTEVLFIDLWMILHYFHWQTYGNRFICSLYSSSPSGSSLNLSYFPVFMLMRDPYLCFMLSPMLLVFSTICLMVSFVDIFQVLKRC
eukprot:TRINITY_DN15251_c0_g1_i1.p1 TRINITY_DN15251_c0_g1~~TRINITY_DN15251_c0_g1_i1.p1  ORF type:complete len:118 (-),score=5.53 TRINITY_DN15251_c0_g1_i1:309-662(-)